MNNFQTIEFETKTQFELVDLTSKVAKILEKSLLPSGVAVVFSPHTTGAIRINHNEALLKQDLMKMLYRIAPLDLNYSHDLFEIRSNVAPNERSNGHAHVKTFLLGQSESIPFEKKKLLLGERQSIFFVEMDGGRKRYVSVQLIGN